MHDYPDEDSTFREMYLMLLICSLGLICFGLCYRLCCCRRGACGMERKGYVIRDAVPSQPIIQPGMEGNQSVAISGSFPEQPSQYSPQVMEGNQSAVITSSFPAQPSQYATPVMEGNQSVVISGSFLEQPSQYSPQVTEGNQSVVITGAFPTQTSQYSPYVMQHNPPEAPPHYEMPAKY